MVVDYLSSQPNRAGYQVSTKQGSCPYLANELIISTDTFDTDARFRQQGGLPRVDYVFGGRFADIIVELNDHMYEEQTA
ncbi:type I restriction-modification enzyme R subunit C-terminal domain-containing protein [Corynebacterium striatum]|uniref:type I restriction-modification enzyme R subunit C-terminal domain-containing protein n=1 Tax=Corynebacterium striatum TaxID=43770 RepID=UPI003B633343